MSSSLLTINLNHLCENFHHMDQLSGRAVCAAVVKANGYGLGLKEVGQALYKTGCRNFFVAHDFEGEGLRTVAPNATIYVLNGPVDDDLQPFTDFDLVPVLNSLGQINKWLNHQSQGQVGPHALHIDTGMNRLGLSVSEFHQLISNQDQLSRMNCCLLMSHLVAADVPDHPLNIQQLISFQNLMDDLPVGLAEVPKSFANSAGIFLGNEYCFDMVRPGIALYGANPVVNSHHQLKQVVLLETRIVQVRDIEPGETVSYGAQFEAKKPMQVATIAVGYGDGYLRSASGRAHIMIKGRKCPVLGRITMDLTIIDATGLDVQAGEMVTIIGPDLRLEEVAGAAGTISYEVLTDLGARYQRRYDFEA